MFNWIKQLFSKSNQTVVQEQVAPIEEQPAPVVSVPDLSKSTPTELVVDETTQQLLNLLDSPDITNHQLAAMLLQGIPFEWTPKRLETIAASAPIFSFWLQESIFAEQLSKFTQLQLKTSFFKNYEDIAPFAAAIPKLQHLEAFYWEAGPYWNQHPILKAVVSLPKLRILSACNCRMHHLPLDIIHAGQLKELYLSKNKMASLPIQLDQLQELERLELDDNAFIEFPTVIGRLKKLNHLKIQRNPLEDVPPHVLGPLYELRSLEVPEKIGRYHLDAYKERLPKVDFDQAHWDFYSAPNY